MRDVVELVASIDGRPAVTIKGRYARCLQTLIQAGQKGASPAIDDPMPRWGHYVFWLRKNYSVSIETVTEKHGGPYAGTHARYVLHSAVTVLKTVFAEDKRSRGFSDVVKAAYAQLVGQTPDATS
jgi:hypothetical protein